MIPGPQPDLAEIDLRDSPDGNYLHDDTQVRAWLVELRTRRAH